MMEGGHKSADLRRDPRMALHSATIDKNVADGDVKLSGRAVEVSDPSVKRAFLAAFKAAVGCGPSDDDPLDLFRIELTEAATIRPAGDHLLIERWASGQQITSIKRY